MNGLKLHIYFGVYYLNFFLTSVFSSFFYLLCCYLFLDLKMIMDTNIGLIILLFLLWAHIQISLAFFFQLFPLTKKVSSIFGYIFSVFMVLIGSNLNSVLFIRPI